MTATLMENKQPLFEKVERDGKIAVLVSPDFGSGFYTWNTDYEGLLFDREIVEPVLAGDIAAATAVVLKKYPGAHFTMEDVEVQWLPKGARFMVEEYDGSETITIIGPDFGHVA